MTEVSVRAAWAATSCTLACSTDLPLEAAAATKDSLLAARVTDPLVAGVPNWAARFLA